MILLSGGTQQLDQFGSQHTLTQTNEGHMHRKNDKIHSNQMTAVSLKISDR